jgi:hypothetical protein
MNLIIIIKRLFAFVVIVGYSQTVKADTIDNFQVYIRQKLILTEKSFSPLSSKLALLELGRTNYRDTIEIHFTHCTAKASNRIIMLKDDKGNIIMKWNFADRDLIETMKIPILDIYKNVDNNPHYPLSLHYYDNQLLPTGVLIAGVILDDLSAIKQQTKKVNDSYFIFSTGGLLPPSTSCGGSC